MEHGIKSQVLKEIMKAMMDRESDSLRPKVAEVSIEEDSPSVESGKLHAPGMEHGDVDDMSDDDAAILGQLWDHGGHDHEGDLSDKHDAQEHEDDEDPDEDDAAGL